MKIADDFFEGKEHGGEGSVERGSDGSGGAYGHESFDFIGAESQLSPQDRGYSRAHLHGWAFAAEGNSAGQGRAGAKEFSKDGAEGDAATAGVERGLGLRHAATARVGKIPVEKIAHAQRAEHRNEQTPPRSVSAGIKMSAEAFGE